VKLGKYISMFWMNLLPLSSGCLSNTSSVLKVEPADSCEVLFPYYTPQKAPYKLYPLTRKFYRFTTEWVVEMNGKLRNIIIIIIITAL
jgi:hypothetical protein